MRTQKTLNILTCDICSKSETSKEYYPKGWKEINLYQEEYEAFKKRKVKDDNEEKRIHFCSKKCFDNFWEDFLTKYYYNQKNPYKDN